MWLRRINPQLNIAWHGTWPTFYVEAARRIYDHQLVLFTRGSCRVTLEDRVYPCPAGTFMIIPPDCVHVTLAENEVERFSFHFDWTYSPRRSDLPYCVFLPGRLHKSGIRRAPRWVLQPFLRGPILRAALVRRLAERIREQWASAEPAARLAARATLLELLMELCARPEQPARQSHRQADLALRVKQVLDEQTESRESIQSLLEGLDFSYAHLMRVFKGHYGIAPLAYLTAARMERAKALLHKKELNIKQVARAIGIEDPAYFSRLFRKATGQSPKAFAQRDRPRIASYPPLLEGYKE